MKAKSIQQSTPVTEDSDFAQIRGLAAALQKLHQEQVAVLTPIVQNLIRSRSRSAQEIEHTLDHLLGSARIQEGLGLFKALCRYYYDIDPTATVSYVYAYRDMWDSDESEDEQTS